MANKMAKLIKLGNGDWVDPNAVKSIRALQYSFDYLETIHLPRLIVEHGQSMSVIEMDIGADIQAAANMLSQEINEAR